MKEVFNKDNGKYTFADDFTSVLSSIHEELQHIIGNYNARKKFEQLLKMLMSVFFPDIWTLIVSFILFSLIILSIIFRLTNGPVLVQGKINNELLLYMSLGFLVMNFIWIFRYLLTETRTYRNKKKALGSDSSTRIFRSLAYMNYSLQEKDLLDGRISIKEKRKILHSLSTLDSKCLNFAEKHYAHLESISKKEENIAITLILTSLGVTLNIAYSFLLSRVSSQQITWIDQGQFLLFFSTFCLALVRRSFQLDSLGTRLEICVNLLKQAQILNQAPEK